MSVTDQKLAAIRSIHQPEMFGDCVEDGEPYPCKTVKVLDWEPSTRAPGDTGNAAAYVAMGRDEEGGE